MAVVTGSMDEGGELRGTAAGAGLDEGAGGHPEPGRLESTFRRLGSAGCGEAFEAEHLRDACKMLAVEAGGLGERLAAAGARRDLSCEGRKELAREAVAAFGRTCGEVRRMAQDVSERQLAELAPAASAPDAVEKRLEHYRAFGASWSEEDWLDEYEAAIEGDDAESAEALERTIGEMVASRAREARRQQIFARAGLHAATPGALGHGVAFQMKFDRLKVRRAQAGHGRYRERLARESARFERLMARRLPVVEEGAAGGGRVE